MAAEDIGKQPVLEEIATSRDGRDITLGYLSPFLLRQPTDKVLLARGAGNYDLYEEIARDDQVGACLQQRKLALVSNEWQVDAASNARRDRYAADRLREVLTRIPWDEINRKMLSGVFYGYSVAEVLWATDGAGITIDAIKVRRQRRFVFGAEGDLRLLTLAKPDGEALPPAKFWAFATGADHDDDPYGLGLAHWLYWPVFFKRNGVKFWLIFLEKFGAPTAKGTYPGNASDEEKRKLLEALAAIQTDSAIRIPEGMQIELIEAARSGTADYTALYDRMNQAIAKIILGQVMTSEAVGGQYKAEVQMDVRQDLVQADADLLCHSFNRTVARWLTAYNDPLASPPRVWRELEEPEDLTSRVGRDKTIFNMGYKPTLQYITETYGGEWAEKPVPRPDSEGMPPTNGAAAATPQTAAEFGDSAPEVPAQTTPDRQTEVLGQAAEPLLQAWLGPVRQALAESSSLAEFSERLDRLFPDLDSAAVADLMGQAFLAAELAGRYEIRTETDSTPTE